MKYRNVVLHNVWEIEEHDGGPGFGLLRIPRVILDAVNPGAQRRARFGAGCEIRGALAEGGAARVTLQCTDANSTPPVATVYHGCFCGQSVVLENRPTEIVIRTPPRFALMEVLHRKDRHPFDPRLVRVRLPPIHTTRILSIEGDWSDPPAGFTPSKTLLFYGSSITQGACAIPPENTYVAQCARRLGCDALNLGFGGSAHMERVLAEHIAARGDWDAAVFEMGINVRDWPREKFHEAVKTFVGVVAAAHPDKFIFCVDLFTNDADFEEHPTRGVGFRETVAEIAAAQRSAKVIHVDGRSILRDPTGLRTDLVHPSDLGMSEMGANLAAFIRRRWRGGRRSFNRHR